MAKVRMVRDPNGKSPIAKSPTGKSPIDEFHASNKVFKDVGCCLLRDIENKIARKVTIRLDFFSLL